MKTDIKLLIVECPDDIELDDLYSAMTKATASKNIKIEIGPYVHLNEDYLKYLKDFPNSETNLRS